ncbi:hypothetical protein BU23DRAFT_634233 [Bimuria novae-zelandiae CBS 107.79]|uniref:Ig-like domain-containing protein n=1 Tax=Bimuria novae-zelandiae CBS 107.79 TaxID=1447943 RepID=A0A6A5VJK0_9PLEO|nr:hypothetical protein BU23DRAFT_634233 [Bimuria novae-zelandiae CBS 107.79]
MRVLYTLPGLLLSSRTIEAYIPADSSKPTVKHEEDCSADGKLLCNGEMQFGLCDRGKVVWQDVALGTVCLNGQIAHAVLSVQSPTITTPTSLTETSNSCKSLATTSTFCTATSAIPPYGCLCRPESSCVEPMAPPKATFQFPFTNSTLISEISSVYISCTSSGWGDDVVTYCPGWFASSCSLATSTPFLTTITDPIATTSVSGKSFSTSYYCMTTSTTSWFETFASCVDADSSRVSPAYNSFTELPPSTPTITASATDPLTTDSPTPSTSEAPVTVQPPPPSGTCDPHCNCATGGKPVPTEGRYLCGWCGSACSSP